MTDATEKVETKSIWIGDVAPETKWDDMKTYFEGVGATLKKLRVKNTKQPWAIISVPVDKYDEVLAGDHTVNGATLSLDEIWKTIRYFLDSRTTKGSLSDLTEEKVTEHFSQFGEVAKCNIMESKGFGFLEMKLEEGNDKVEGLAWQHHEIDGHVINVKEQQRRKRNNKRKWKGKGRKGGKRKWNKKKKN